MSLEAVGTTSTTTAAERLETEISAKTKRIDVFGKRTLNHLTPNQLKDFHRMEIELGLSNKVLAEDAQVLRGAGALEAVNRMFDMTVKGIESFWNGVITPTFKNVSTVLDSPKGNRVLLGTDGKTYSQGGPIKAIILLVARIFGVSFDKEKVVKTLTPIQTRLRAIKDGAVLTFREEETLEKIDLLIGRLQGKKCPVELFFSRDKADHKRLGKLFAQFDEIDANRSAQKGASQTDSTQRWDKILPGQGPSPIVGAPKGASPLYNVE